MTTARRKRRVRKPAKPEVLWCAPAGVIITPALEAQLLAHRKALGRGLKPEEVAAVAADLASPCRRCPFLAAALANRPPAEGT